MPKRSLRDGMKKRSISDRPLSKSSIGVGCTIVASWLPWKYWVISTIRVSYNDDPFFRKKNEARAQPIQDYYVTQVHRCDQMGFVRDTAEIYFEQKYGSIEEAELGHDEAARNLFNGRLRLRKMNQLEELLNQFRTD